MAAIASEDLYPGYPGLDLTPRIENCVVHAICSDRSQILNFVDVRPVADEHSARDASWLARSWAMDSSLDTTIHSVAHKPERSELLNRFRVCC